MRWGFSLGQSRKLFELDLKAAVSTQSTLSQSVLLDPGETYRPCHSRKRALLDYLFHASDRAVRFSSIRIFKRYHFGLEAIHAADVGGKGRHKSFFHSLHFFPSSHIVIKQPQACTVKGGSKLSPNFTQASTRISTCHTRESLLISNNPTYGALGMEMKGSEKKFEEAN